METEQNFKSELMHNKKLQIVLSLFAVVMLLLAYGLFRDHSKVISAEEANTLLIEGKIEKIIIDGEYMHLLTDAEDYKVYAEALKGDEYLKQFPVEVRTDPEYIYNILSLLILAGAFLFLFRLATRRPPIPGTGSCPWTRPCMITITRASLVQSRKAAQQIIPLMMPTG